MYIIYLYTYLHSIFLFYCRTMATFFSYPDQKLQDELKKTAEEIVAPGKGILAVDEANGNIDFTYITKLNYSYSMAPYSISS